MFDVLECPMPNCIDNIELLNGSHENDYCDFQEAECPQCCQSFWLVTLDGKTTLRIREDDDKVEFSEHNCSISAA